VAQLNNWLLDIALDTLMQGRAALAEAPLAVPAFTNHTERSKHALPALRRANEEEFIVRGLLAHAEALWRCGDAKAADDPLREAETIAARGPMPLFMADAHLLRARIALSQNNLAAAKAKRDAASELIEKHGYGKTKPELAVLNAEIACAENAANRDAAIAAAIAAIRGESYDDERSGITIDGGWWGLLPRLELLLSAGDPRIADLHAVRDAYNAERDAYLRSTLVRDAEDYDPADDPITAYLGANVWEEEDRALADPAFRRELSEALVRAGYKPLDETPISEQRNAARQYLKLKREAQGKKKEADLPEISDEVLDQVLADATTCEAIETMLKNAGVKEPLKTLPRETQRQAVAVFHVMLEKLKEE
jgi:hypothetical protein